MLGRGAHRAYAGAGSTPGTLTIGDFVHVALVGGTLWGNRGAEAMVETTIGLISERDPGVEFTVLSYFPDEDRTLVDDERVQIASATPAAMVVDCLLAAVVRVLQLVGVRLPDRLLPGSLAAVRRADCLLDVSGIAFHDGRLAVVVYHLVSVWPAFALRVPVVRLSQALGPFENPANRAVARWTLRRTQMTFARGDRSAAFVRSLGIPPARWSQAPDLAFAFRDDMALTSENDARLAEVLAHLVEVQSVDTAVVALVPSSLVASQAERRGTDHVAQLAVWVRRLAAAGHHVVVMPHATREGCAASRNNDLVVITRLHKLLAQDPCADDVSYVDFDVNAASIRRLVRRCDIMITSRFHAMVAALAEGVIPVTVGWSHKYLEVLEPFGSEDLACDFKDVGTDVVERTLALLHDDVRAREIRGRAAEMGLQARAQVDTVLALLDHSARPSSDAS